MAPIHPARAVILAGALVACGGETTAPAVTGTCTTQFAIAVTSGTTPIFTWPGGCMVGAITVSRLTSQNPGDLRLLAWQIVGIGAGGTGRRNRISSGVRYGEPPAGATLERAADALQPGVTYHALAAVESDFGLLVPVGTVTFVP
ncbi:MAG: hypothetical protein ACOY71_12140 [Gemmatimonadota bacterium]